VLVEKPGFSFSCFFFLLPDAGGYSACTQQDLLAGPWPISWQRRPVGYCTPGIGLITSLTVANRRCAASVLVTVIRHRHRDPARRRGRESRPVIACRDRSPISYWGRSQTRAAFVDRRCERHRAHHRVLFWLRLKTQRRSLLRRFRHRRRPAGGEISCVSSPMIGARTNHTPVFFVEL